MTSNKPATKKESEYQALVSERAPKSRVLPQCIQAFVSGGLICCIGQLFRDFARLRLGLEEKEVAAFTAIVMVFIGATLTGVGIYDRIGA